MNIEHVAVWTNNLETLKEFYVKFFSALASEKYTNVEIGFTSYFLKFDSGARLEIMNMQSSSGQIEQTDPEEEQYVGYSHLAFSVGSRERVESLTAALRQRGYRVVSGPRETGDGYYESCILDPDGNRIEITV